MLEDVNLKYSVKKNNRMKDWMWGRTAVEQENSEIHALKNINLALGDGDRLGIIGHNGAGKSSLLKLIAGIYPPTSGRCAAAGRMACLFELATGFEMEATGWDNIYIRGLMLGETPKSIHNKKQDIAEFSGLGKYLDVPVKYYSSGMFIRLAFSVSTAIEPEILLLDEVVAAGDAEFLSRAEKRMKELMNKVRILVFVTHSMDTLRDFCNTCIWLEQGTLRMKGNTAEVSRAYLNDVQVKKGRS